MKRQMCEENSHICLFEHLLFVAIQRGLAPSDEEMVELRANIEKMLGKEFRGVNRGALNSVLRREAGNFRKILKYSLPRHASFGLHATHFSLYTFKRM